MKRYLFVIALSIFGHAVPASHAASLSSYELAGWSIGAYSNDQTGQFSHCGTSVSYQSGIMMLFAVDANFQWSIAFANDNWRLRVGDRFDIFYQIDRAPRLKANASVIGTDLVEVPLPANSTLFDLFRRGYQLTVFARGGTFHFNLKNSSKALTAVLECTRRYVAISARSKVRNPFTADNEKTSRSADSKLALRSEASIVAANILASSGVQGFKVLPTDAIPDELRVYDAVWSTDGGLLGTVKVISSKIAKNLDDVSAAIISNDARSCKGRFGSAKQETSISGIRLKTGCEDAGSTIEVTYSVVQRSKGGFYVFGIYANINPDTPEKNNEGQVHDAAMKFGSGH